MSAVINLLNVWPRKRFGDLSHPCHISCEQFRYRPGIVSADIPVWRDKGAGQMRNDFALAAVSC